VVFGTSSGEIEFHRLNLTKRRLELLSQNTLRLNGSVLSMKRVKSNKTKKAFIFVGMSSGDLVLVEVSDELNTRILTTIKVHDFGINSLDATRGSNNTLVVATGGDDQNIALSVFNSDG
jgi:hypothetical protein